jgi:hypothetical protein
MSGDILSPLFLFPKFTTLYAICKRSNHFEIKDRTWDQLKDDMKSILINGSDENSWYYHNAYYHKRKDSTNIIHLKDKAKILFEEDDSDTKKWTLEFNYDGQTRKLIYFYERNFLDDWSNLPKAGHSLEANEIKDISQILIINTPFMIPLIDNQRNKYIEMIKKHVTYTLVFNGHSGANGYHNLENTFELKINDIKKTIETMTIQNEDEINKLDAIDYKKGSALHKARIRLRIEEGESNDKQIHRDKMEDTLYRIRMRGKRLKRRQKINKN